MNQQEANCIESSVEGVTLDQQKSLGIPNGQEELPTYVHFCSTWCWIFNSGKIF